MLVTKGERTRTAILETATGLASQEGLDGLSIGRLADATGLSKSGLFAHFGSKEELQLATVDHAAAIFVREVIEPARAAPKGVARVWALCDNLVSYLEREVFPGGCFMFTTLMEFKNRPGPVRDRLTELLGTWRGYLAHAIEQAQELGELDGCPSADALAFELNGLGNGANIDFQIFRDPQVFENARLAMRDRIESYRP